MIMTRSDYMADGCHKVPSDQAAGSSAHRRYYSQLVGRSTIDHVVRTIGADALLSSADRHFNDIPLRLWYAAIKGLPCAKRFAELGDYATEAGLVCVAKEAALQWVEEQTSKNKGTEE